MKLPLFVIGVLSTFELSQGWKCKECLNYEGEPGYLSLTKLPQLLDSACVDNETAVALFQHFLQNCYLQYPGIVPAHVDVEAINLSEYCAQIRYEANVREALDGGELCYPGLTHINTTYEIRHRLCFSKNVGVLEGCTSYIKRVLVPNCQSDGEKDRDTGIWETIYVTPDDQRLKETIPVMKQSIWLCSEDTCDKGHTTKVVCKSEKTVASASGSQCVS